MNWIKYEPLYTPDGDYNENCTDNDLIQKVGVILKKSDESIVLVGHINTQFGECGCCKMDDIAFYSFDLVDQINSLMPEIMDRTI